MRYRFEVDTANGSTARVDEFWVVGRVKGTSFCFRACVLCAHTSGNVNELHAAISLTAIDDGSPLENLPSLAYPPYAVNLITRVIFSFMRGGSSPPVDDYAPLLNWPRRALHGGIFWSPKNPWAKR
jgi:hypothetical protein